MTSDFNPSSREFFERMYQRAADPWNFAGDTYELSRYDAILNALSGQRFTRVFEPGCSVGVLTARLAPFCDELLAIDLSETAVAKARERCAAYTHAHIEQASVADANPGPLDLLVLSEIGYYFSVSDLYVWADRLLSQLMPGGFLLASHWLGFSPDHLLSGEHVQDIIQNLAKGRGFVLAFVQRTENFRLELWKRQ
jgi:predicted TPR repeat methyltransferase